MFIILKMYWNTLLKNNETKETFETDIAEWSKPVLSILPTMKKHIQGLCDATGARYNTARSYWNNHVRMATFEWPHICI